MKRTLFALVVAALLVGSVAAPAIAQAVYVSYVVQHGDTLAKIANHFCTSWEEIHQLNRHTIGPNPNNLEAGTLLQVPDYCGDGPGGGVHDRGPRLHANGTVQGNVYTVAPGDTFYSIGQRFGVPVQELQRVNRTDKLYAGARIIIPGLPPPPPPQPPVVPNPAYIAIDSPVPGSIVPRTFTVSGRAGNLFEGNVVVRALDQYGNVLAELPTTVQGPDVGIGGDGHWSTTLTVFANPNSSGAVTAFSPGSTAQASVPVTYAADGAQLPPREFAPGECVIYGQPYATLYQYPGGAQAGQFVAGGPVEARQRTYQGARTGT